MIDRSHVVSDPINLTDGRGLDPTTVDASFSCCFRSQKLAATLYYLRMREDIIIGNIKQASVSTP